MDFKTLWKGKWVDVISPKDHPYECLHEKDGVCIIPVIKNKVGIRFEFCPPYMIKDKVGVRNYYTIMSGGKDGDEDIKDTAIRELREEAGVIVKKATLYRLYENIAFVKNTDMRSSLVVVMVKDYDMETPKGDGTVDEKKSKTVWTTKEELNNIMKKDNIDSLLWFAGFIIRGILQ